MAELSLMVLAPFGLGALLAAVSLLVVVRRLAAESRGERAQAEAALRGALAEAEGARAQAVEDAEGLRRALARSQEAVLELEERLEIREEWVALRDEQLSRAQSEASEASRRLSRAQGELDALREQRQGLSAQLGAREQAVGELRRERESLLSRAQGAEALQERVGALSEALRRLTASALGPGEVLPEDPLEAARVAASRLHVHHVSQGAIAQDAEGLRAEVASLRRSLSATTQSYQAYRERTEAELDAFANALGPAARRLREDLPAEVARAVARRQSAELQLKAARAELDDLRTKLRFANRTIVALEQQLAEASGPDPMVPDMLAGLRSPSMPPE